MWPRGAITLTKFLKISSVYSVKEDVVEKRVIVEKSPSGGTRAINGSDLTSMAGSEPPWFIW